jgi:tryptophan synthase alpha chain
VTGAANLDVADVAQRIEHIRGYITLPVGVGFGIRDADTARRIAAVSDAVVIGSKLVEEIAAAGSNAPGRVEVFMAEIRQAMDSLQSVKAVV